MAAYADDKRLLREAGRPLSDRQRQALLWIARGKTYNDVAAILGLTFGSVKTHLDMARLKLNAINLSHAVALAFALGVLSKAELLEGRADTGEAQ
jgi:LuxR family transcriptional regulator, activator of conjugal transfer of Ti plasmids